MLRKVVGPMCPPTLCRGRSLCLLKLLTTKKKEVDLMEDINASKEKLKGIKNTVRELGVSL